MSEQCWAVPIELIMLELYSYIPLVVRERICQWKCNPWLQGICKAHGKHLLGKGHLQVIYLCFGSWKDSLSRAGWPISLDSTLLWHCIDSAKGLESYPAKADWNFPDTEKFLVGVQLTWPALCLLLLVPRGVLGMEWAWPEHSGCWWALTACWHHKLEQLWRCSGCGSRTEDT